MKNRVITDGEKYLKIDFDGRVTPTCEALADVFTLAEANDIYNRKLKKKWKARFRIEKIETVHEDKNIKVIFRKRYKNLKNENDLTKCINRLVNKFTEVSDIIKESKERLNSLSKDLSIVDRELSDIRHYVEFSKLNASQGYNAYKMERERLIRRRAIKDEMELIKAILRCNMSDDLSEVIKNTTDKLMRRTYSPRVIEELFDC